MICGIVNILDDKGIYVFSILIEDKSTEVLVNHVMVKLQKMYPDKYIDCNIKSFSGIGHISKTGNLQERKGSNLLNNLRPYLRGFDRSLSNMPQAAIIVVLDNDKRDCVEFQKHWIQLQKNLL